MNTIIDMYNHIDIWLMIFCRILFALIFLPILVESKLPPILQGGISAILTTIVFFTIDIIPIQYTHTLIGFGMMLLKEIIIGLIIGFSVFIFFQVYYFVGNLLSTQGGIGMSTILDPVNGAQMPILGRLYYLGFCTIFMISGGFHWFISALIETFTHIPLGDGVIRPDLVYVVVEAVAIFWEISFKLAAPIIAVIFIIDCGLGILARTVPQMNMFVIGLPLKMIVLFVMLIITVTLLPSFNNLIIENMTNTFFNILQGLMP